MATNNDEMTPSEQFEKAFENHKENFHAELLTDLEVESLQDAIADMGDQLRKERNPEKALEKYLQELLDLFNEYERLNSERILKQNDGEELERKKQRYEVPKGWEKVFERCREEVDEALDIIEERKRKNIVVFPRPNQFFRVHEDMQPKEVVVVILAMDPYHGLAENGRPQAQGRAFEVPRGVKLPSSLQNIFKEVRNCYPDSFRIPLHGCLDKWAKQGVFLLNASLSVEKGKPDSHKNLWNALVEETLKEIHANNPKAVYLLWGKNAQSMRSHINKKGKVFESSHPSGLSANRGFIGCGHFKKVNDYLESIGKNPIDWNV